MTQAIAWQQTYTIEVTRDGRTSSEVFAGYQIAAGFYRHQVAQNYDTVRLIDGSGKVLKEVPR